MRTRVKICGITSVRDALAAVEAGVDGVGLVFYADSPRWVSPEQARAIAYAMAPLVSLVGLFVNASAEQVRETLRAVPLHLLQFHGQESPEFCRSFGLPYIKAIRVRNVRGPEVPPGDYRDAAGLLFDAWSPQVPGGTGQTFNWDLLPKQVQRPVLLAGGLTPANVGEAVHWTRPYAVDVSGGVELARGVKDAGLMAAFVHAVHAADASR